jgi:hypothetical protein
MRLGPEGLRRNNTIPKNHVAATPAPKSLVASERCSEERRRKPLAPKSWRQA